MSRVKGFRERLGRLTKWCNWIAYAACSGMLLVSVVDILGSKLLRLPLPGAADMLGLIAVVVAAFPIAATQLSGGHVRLDLGLEVVPKYTKKFFQVIGSSLNIVLFVLFIVGSIRYGISLQRTGEASMTIALPLFPFVFAFVLACLPALLVCTLELIELLSRGNRDER